MLLIRSVSAVPLVAAAVFACTPRSVEPLYQQDEAVVAPGLDGSWISGDAGARIEIGAPDPAGIYAASVRSTDPDEPDGISVRVHLLEIDGGRFFDAECVRAADEPEDAFQRTYGSCGHFLGRWNLTGDTLSVGLLDEDWLREALASGAVTMSHAELEDDAETGGALAIAATTAELREFVRRYGRDEDAFPMDILVRER